MCLNPNSAIDYHKLNMAEYTRSKVFHHVFGYPGPIPENQLPKKLIYAIIIECLEMKILNQLETI